MSSKISCFDILGKGAIIWLNNEFKSFTALTEIDAGITKAVEQTQRDTYIDTASAGGVLCDVAVTDTPCHLPHQEKTMKHSHTFAWLRTSQRLVRELGEKENQVMRHLAFSGKKIMALGLVQNVQNEALQVQPASIDFTLKRLASLASKGLIDFTNVKRTLPEYKSLEFHDDMIHLQPGVYVVEFNETVALPNNVIGLMRTRSSVFRSGAIVTGGVIDPGYAGAVVALLQVWNKHGIALSRNARLAQWVFAAVDEPHQEGYKGIYQDAQKIFSDSSLVRRENGEA